MDYYHELQVQPHAEPEVIERAYRALSMKYHPDRSQARERTAATRKMQRINEAYAVLRDPDRRALYDRTHTRERTAAWDRFMDVGLVGIFVDRFKDRAGG